MLLTEVIIAAYASSKSIIPASLSAYALLTAIKITKTLLLTPKPWVAVQRAPEVGYMV